MKDRKTFDDFIGTDIDKEVDDFVNTLFDDVVEDSPLTAEETWKAGEAFVDSDWKENKDCPKCKGAGWVWGNELENGHEDYETDNQYICDDPCHTVVDAEKELLNSFINAEKERLNSFDQVNIQKQCLKNYIEQSTTEDVKREVELINETLDSESTQTMPTSGHEDPYEEQFQFFMANLSENLKSLVSSFLFIDGQDSVTFNVETTFKKKCKALTQCQSDMQTCFENKFWNGKKIIVEAIKEQS